MLTPEQIRQYAERRVREFKVSIVNATSLFPMEVQRFGRAKTHEGMAVVRPEIETLMAGAKNEHYHSYTVERRDTRSTNLGSRQMLPERVYFQTEEDFTGWLGINREIAIFRRNLEATQKRCPRLADWIPGNIARFDQYAGEWSDLLTVCEYFAANPRPHLYARELPIPVHTKFVESHERILDSLLSHVLADALDPAAEDFYTKFHLRDKEPFIECRILDPRIAIERSFPLRHFKVPICEIAPLPFSGLKVLVVENRLPLLTLPDLPGTIAVFGGGNAVGLLTSALWMRESDLLYWGDIDEYGFSILAQFRAFLPRAQAVLMDLATFDHFAAFQVEYPPPGRTPELSLTEDELGARAATIRSKKRLEQERIDLAYAHSVLLRALGGAEPPDTGEGRDNH